MEWNRFLKRMQPIELPQELEEHADDTRIQSLFPVPSPASTHNQDTPEHYLQ
jgi:hypothetical protein